MIILLLVLGSPIDEAKANLSLAFAFSKPAVPIPVVPLTLVAQVKPMRLYYQAELMKLQDCSNGQCSNTQMSRVLIRSNSFRRMFNGR